MEKTLIIHRVRVSENSSIDSCFTKVKMYKTEFEKINEEIVTPDFIHIYVPVFSDEGVVVSNLVNVQPKDIK